MATCPRSSGHDGGPPSITSSLLSNRTTATSARAANYPSHSQNPSGPRPPLSWLAEINDQFPLSLLPLESSSTSAFTSTPTSQQDPSPTQAFMRKMSEPVIGGALRSKMNQNNSYQEQLARQSLLPMPPQYAEGSHWAILQLRVLSSPEEELSRRKWLRVEVVKKSLKVDGRWGREKPFVVEHRWEDWVDFRDQVVNKFPVTDQILPKLTKTTLFSSITTSKKSVFYSNLKELEHFLAALLSCSRTVLDSKLVHKMFETEKMHKGLHQVEYDVINPDQRSLADEEMDETPFSKASSQPPKSATFNHLELYTFPPPVSEEIRLKTPPIPDHPYSMRHQALPPNVSPTRRPSTTDPVAFCGNPPSLRSTLRAIPASTMPFVEPRRSPERAATMPKSMQKTPNAPSGYWTGPLQDDSALPRRKTSETIALRRRPIQPESDSDATVRVSRSVRAPRTRNQTAGDSGSASSGRTGCVPPRRPSYVSRPSLLDATQQQPGANLQKVLRTRRPTEHLVTSGATALLGYTDPHESPCSEWLRHPDNLSSSASRVPRLPLEDRNSDSFESDTRTIVPTSHPTLPAHPALVGKLSLNANSRSNTFHGHRKNSEPPFTRTRPSKEDFDPLWKQSVPSNNAPEPVSVPNRLIKPRPAVRPFKSMQDMRSAAARMNPSDAAPMPSDSSPSTCSLSPHNMTLSKAQPGSARAVGLALSTAPAYVIDSLCASERGAFKMRPTRQHTHPSLDRGESSLRAGRHRIRAGSQDTAPTQSPTRRLCSRQSLTSSNSSFGSFSHSSSMPSSASSTSCVPPTDFKQRRSGSTSSSGSMTLSDASAHSPLQPVTPGQTQLQTNVVIDTNNTSLLEGECGKSTRYVYDPDKGRFIGHHTIPPAPFFPLPPAPDHKEPFSPGASYVHDGQRHVVQRRPHTAGGASADGTAASSELLGRPFALPGSGGKAAPSVPAATNLPATPPITTTHEGLVGSVAVKVTHADSGINIAIRVPKSIGLAQLKSQIAHKFVGGAQVHLPNGWELLVSLDQAQTGHLLCSDEELGKLMLSKTSLASRKITLKLV